MPARADEFKRALSRFASGVTVVTVAESGRMHGMTASSFASVSLDPPLVLVCLDKRSQTLALLVNTRSFAINVLSSAQEHVARAFSATGIKPFENFPHRAGALGPPLLDDAIAWLECRTHSTVPGGDHEIVIGAVDSCRATDGEPLVYYDRTYRSIADLL